VQLRDAAAGRVVVVLVQQPPPAPHQRVVDQAAGVGAQGHAGARGRRRREHLLGAGAPAGAVHQVRHHEAGEHHQVTQRLRTDGKQNRPMSNQRC